LYHARDVTADLVSKGKLVVVVVVVVVVFGAGEVD